MMERIGRETEEGGKSRRDGDGWRRWVLIQRMDVNCTKAFLY